MDSKAWKTILDELEGKNNHFLASGNTGLMGTERQTNGSTEDFV